MRKILILALLLSIALPTILVASVQAAETTYTISALSPISNRNVFYGGSVIDVKFQLLDSSGNKVTTATATLWIDGDPAVGRGQFNTGNTFTLQQKTYVFKWDTSPITAGPGTPSHTLTIKVTIDATKLSQDFPIALH